MKRSDFIRTGILGGTGLLFFPSLLLANNPGSKLQDFELPGIIPQPRHGNFCTQTYTIDQELQIHSRDRLLKNGMQSSDEDLLSVNLSFKGKSMNLTLSAEECWLNSEDVNRRLPIRGAISSIAKDLQLIHGYTNVEKCSLNSKLYILPLAGQFKLNNKLYYENKCLLAEGFEKLSIESSKSSRILLLTS